MFKCILCNFTTNNRKQIHKHHINPQEVTKDNNKYNYIFVCPTCHKKIYSPSATKGIHSSKKINSIIIHRWLYSTEGRILEIFRNNNIEYIVEEIS